MCQELPSELLHWCWHFVQGVHSSKFNDSCQCLYSQFYLQPLALFIFQAPLLLNTAWICGRCCLPYIGFGHLMIVTEHLYSIQAKTNNDGSTYASAAGCCCDSSLRAVRLVLWSPSSSTSSRRWQGA
jgi:hypothetical protein